MNGRPRAGRAVVRGALAVCAAVGILGLLAAPPFEGTEAAWVDTESANATLGALTVPMPEGGAAPQCRASNVALLGSRLTIQWKAPAGYTSADAQFAKQNNGLLDPITGPLLSSITTSGDPSNYTTVVAGGLLSNTLGGSIVFGIRLVGPGGWTSNWLATTATFPAVIGTNNCTLYTIPST